MEKGNLKTDFGKDIGKNTWKRVIWAVDPFTEDNKLQTSAAWAVRALAPDSKTEVEPVYMLNEYPLGVPTALPPEILSQTEDSGQEELDRILARVKIKNLLPFKVITGAYHGQREVAHALVSYAKKMEAGLIVLSTHARKGLHRLFMGSFAESLMLYSDVPLFVVNPTWKSTTDFKNILFPTDFSDESNEVFGRVMDLAKTLQAELTIFHQVRYVMSPEVQASFTSYPIYQEAYEYELKAAKEQANRLADLAKGQGIEAHAHIEYKYETSVAESILKFARKKHFIIAMAARSTRVSAVLLGSTARRVLRESKYPVWVIHPEKKEENKVVPLETKKNLDQGPSTNSSRDESKRGMII